MRFQSPPPRPLMPSGPHSVGDSNPILAGLPGLGSLPDSMQAEVEPVPRQPTMVGGVVGAGGALLQRPDEAAALASVHGANGASFLVVDAGQHDPVASVAEVRAVANTFEWRTGAIGVLAVVSDPAQISPMCAEGLGGVIDATPPQEGAVALEAAVNNASLMVSVGATSAPASERALALSAKLAAAEAAGLADDKVGILDVADPGQIRHSMPILDLGRPTAVLMRWSSTNAELVAGHALAATMGFGMVMARDVRRARRAVHLIDTVHAVRSEDRVGPMQAADGGSR